jgi:hypothetical protein
MAVIDAEPCTVITSAEGVPAVPKAGCFAEVAAPVGSGREAADTGWVTEDPSTLRAVIEAMPWTVMTSVDAVPAVPKAGCLAAVDAPAGRGSDAAETGTVLFGLTATTKAGSAATAAVDAALTAAVFVPSVIRVLWVPPVSVESKAREPEVPMFAVTVLVPEALEDVPIFVEVVA